MGLAIETVDRLALEAVVWRAVELSKFYDDAKKLRMPSQRLELLMQAGSIGFWYVMATEEFNGAPVAGCKPASYPTGLTVELEASGDLTVSCSQGFAGGPADSQVFDPHVIATGPLGPLKG